MAAASLGALGVVYGDIGTSPLYAVKECLAWPHSHGVADGQPTNVLGVMSLVFWSLVLVIVVKYLVFVCAPTTRARAASSRWRRSSRQLDASAEPARAHAPLLVALGSSAPPPVRRRRHHAGHLRAGRGGGPEVADHAVHAVVPITMAILVGLFLVQRRGTGARRRVFGWIMLVWFVVHRRAGAAAGSCGPEVLGRSTRHAWRVLRHARHWHGFLLLGSVVLVVTGGEALYADMGHFGRKPIRWAWYAVVLPGLCSTTSARARCSCTDPAPSRKPVLRLVSGVFGLPMWCSPRWPR
jgi:KUP system potassium uptake protein